MILGDRVQQDRDRCGLTQDELAKALAKLLQQKRFRALKGRPISDDPDAIRAWIAKLETGRLRREVGEEVKQLLAVALKPYAEAEVYRTLPLQPPRSVLQADEPREFRFEELWVFSRRPLEVRHSAYPREMLSHWLAADGNATVRPVVYFVPPGGVADDLAAVIRTALSEQRSALDILRKNVHIEETSAASLLLVPHCFIRFSSPKGTEPMYDGWVELLQSQAHKRQFGQMPQEHVEHVVLTLNRAGVLGSDLRYKRGDGTPRRGPDSLEFKTIPLE
mgnify:CR=1 FL=1